jgi:AcrR family transcriptional regulator
VQIQLGVETTWREPSQQRSRDRVAAILIAARELIAKEGLAGLKMAPLAKRAGVPIGTIYQFFPDKDSVIACIFATQMEEALEDLAIACQPEKDLDSQIRATVGILETKYREWRDDPVMAEIWSIAQANRPLRPFALASSRACAEIMVSSLRRFLRPGVTEDRLWRFCFLTSELYDSAIRTALAFPEDEAMLMIEEYANLVALSMNNMLKETRRSPTSSPRKAEPTPSNRRKRKA